jgi:hypothetical protein
MLFRSLPESWEPRLGEKGPAGFQLAALFQSLHLLSRVWDKLPKRLSA